MSGNIMGRPVTVDANCMNTSWKSIHKVISLMCWRWYSIRTANELPGDDRSRWL